MDEKDLQLVSNIASQYGVKVVDSEKIDFHVVDTLCICLLDDLRNIANSGYRAALFIDYVSLCRVRSKILPVVSIDGLS